MSRAVSPVAAGVVTLSATMMQSLSRLQDGLNAMINPTWRRVRTLDDWSLAITMEAAELIDSYPWKWWKGVAGVVDMANVKIELADLLHFALSGMMQRSACDEQSCVVKARAVLPCLPFVPHDDTTMSSACAAHTCDAPSDTLPAEAYVFRPLHEAAKAVATFRNVVQLAQVYRFDTIARCLVLAADDLHFNLVAYYVAKHTLNYIRQLGGYKAGTYVKVNAGVEDNALLHDCIADVTLDMATDEQRYVDVWDMVAQRVYDAFRVPHEDRKDIHYWMARAEAAP